MKDNSLAEYIASGAFDEAIDFTQQFTGRMTGFENWDEKSVFLPALIVLGGTPGTGKTTFTSQLLSNLAAGDSSRQMKPERCVFCAYEMSKAELAAKSIAREVRRMSFNDESIKCLSSSQIRLGAGRFNDAVQKAQEKIAREMRNLQILEMENETIDELLKILKEEAEAAKAANMPLTVAVDYLQLVPTKAPKATAKERVDELVLKFKQFQRATNSTVIIISSLNRVACVTGGTNMFSFKESGSVEYSADVVWLLQCTDAEKENFSPRPVKLSCVKNRHGSLYTVEFEYFSANDYFRGCSPSPSSTTPPKKTKKTKRDC